VSYIVPISLGHEPPSNRVPEDNLKLDKLVDKVIRAVIVVFDLATFGLFSKLGSFCFFSPDNSQPPIETMVNDVKQPEKVWAKTYKPIITIVDIIAKQNELEQKIVDLEKALTTPPNQQQTNSFKEQITGLQEQLLANFPDAKEKTGSIPGDLYTKLDRFARLLGGTLMPIERHLLKNISWASSDGINATSQANQPIANASEIKKVQVVEESFLERVEAILEMLHSIACWLSGHNPNTGEKREHLSCFVRTQLKKEEVALMLHKDPDDSYKSPYDLNQLQKPLSGNYIPSYLRETN
jgi:hypothetical protein